MIFTQYYLDCLSQASYLIADENTARAVVVDPRRDIAEYLADIEAHQLTVVAIIETHFHADFLSGHLELAAATGAEIVYASAATAEFPIRRVDDRERLSLGDVTIEFRHTPGHTPESMSLVVFEHPDDAVPYGVLTGDTLFIGDVGRPDLLASIGVTGEELANQLYDSLHRQLLTLPDPTRVFPGHGAGSACGKNLSTETQSTIGEQRLTNYALRAATKADFLQLVTEGQPPAPDYFAYDALLNRKDRPLLDEAAVPASLDLDQLDVLRATGAVLLDGRSPEAFAAGHIDGALNVGLAGRYAEFAGSVVPSDVDIVLTVPEAFVLEAKNRLARIGFDRVVGCIPNPEAVLAEHPHRARRASRLSAAEFAERRNELSNLVVIDVRNPGEFALGAVPGATNIAVGELPDVVSDLDATAPTVVYCAGGYRSSVAASLLRAHGFRDVSDVLGGYQAWAELQSAAPAS